MAKNTHQLTPKQRRFVAEYLVDSNATQAAIRAGYSPRSAHSIANELVEKPDIRAAIEAAEQRRLNRLDLKADDILRELLTFAKTDIRKAFDKSGRLLPIHEMPEDVARAISGVKVFEEFDGQGSERVKVGDVREVKFWDKVKGLELLGKHLKLFTDKIEMKVDGSFADELKKARERARKQ